MTQPFFQLDQASLLRLEAEVRLENGAVNSSFQWPVSMETLHCLLNQTGSPAGAELSLKVLHELHELQVFQVELDLIHRQMVNNELRLSEDLQLYQGVFAQLPQPCFILDPSGLVHSANLAAQALTDGQRAGVAVGEPLLKLLVKESQLLLHSVLLQLQAGSRREQLLLQFRGQEFCLPWQATQLSAKHFVLLQTELEP